MNTRKHYISTFPKENTVKQYVYQCCHFSEFYSTSSGIMSKMKKISKLNKEFFVHKFILKKFFIVKILKKNLQCYHLQKIFYRQNLNFIYKVSYLR